MHTFEAISFIRRQALSQRDALRYLMEHFGFSTTLAREVVSVIFGPPQERQAAGISDKTR